MYEGFNFESDEFRDVYTGFGDIKEYDEVTMRNHITYWLGKGFDEFYWSTTECNRQSKKLVVDVFADRQGALKDDDLRLEIRAELRIKLVCKILSQIAKTSPYVTYYEDYSKKRRRFIERNLKPIPLREHLLAWIEISD